MSNYDAPYKKAPSKTEGVPGSNGSRKPFREALGELGAAREAARRELRSLSIRAKDGKDELGSNLMVLEQRFERGADKARAAAVSKAREVAKAFQGFLSRYGRGRPSLTTPVEGIMNARVVSCGPNDTLDHAAQIMWEHDCGIVPVIGADGKLAGVITDRDICMASHLQHRALDGANVGSAMSRQLFTCAPTDAVEHALELMSSRQVRRLPVIHADGRLAGLVSLADLTGHAQALAGESVQSYARMGFILAAISERRGEPQRGAHAAE